MESWNINVCNDCGRVVDAVGTCICPHEQSTREIQVVPEMVGEEVPGPRSCVFVAADHNPGDVRIFYEIPNVVAERICPGEQDDPRTFVQALVDALEGSS